MSSRNLHIVVWHGDRRSLYYLVDADAPEEEQPCVLETCSSLQEAEARRQTLQGCLNKPEEGGSA